MDDKGTISYFIHEGIMTRMERTNHRLWILVLVLIFALIATNLAWILYEQQFEYYEETVTQEVTQSAESENGGAINRFVGGDYGEGNADNTDDNN